MSFIDLHVHSNASDGTLSPAAVIRLADTAGLSAIALTDHDTVSGIPEALNTKCLTSLEVIPGIELSCMYQKTEIHILGLYIDPTHPTLLNRLQSIQQIRYTRNLACIENFNNHNIPISMVELTQGNPQATITRAHFARVLLQKGYVSSMHQAFQKYLSYDKGFCSPKKELSTAMALDLIKQSGGISVLAHPFLYHLDIGQIDKMVADLIPLGLTGIEVYHSSHNQCTSRKLELLAKKYQLLLTGGSDFHGTNKPDIQIGKGRGNLAVSAALLKQIKASVSPAG